MTDIVQKENKFLREIAQPVPVEKIATKEIQEVIKKMKDAMHGEDDAVGIAAPQIGVSLRIFIVSGGVFPRGSDPQTGLPLPGDDIVCINPELTKLSRDKQKLDEGCLSVRWWYGFVERSEKATITAYNEKGERFTRGGSKLLAQIFQHEMDHLNGILFIDKASALREEVPNKKRAARKVARGESF